MSFVTSFVQDLVASNERHLDRVQLSIHDAQFETAQTEPSYDEDDAKTDLRASITQLSSSVPTHHHLRRRETISDALQHVTHAAAGSDEDLEWILLGRATTQTYGIVLDRLLRQVLPLNDEITYWNEVLTSNRYTALHSLQISPLRFWNWSKSIYEEVQASDNIAKDSWNEFYGLVRSTIRKRSLAETRAGISQPIAIIRGDIQAKVARLERTKAIYAGSIGYLLAHGLESNAKETQALSTSRASGASDWRQRIENEVRLVDAALSVSKRPELSHDSYEAAVTSVHDHEAASQDLTAADLAKQLQRVLNEHLPEHIESSKRVMQENQKPSRLVRYWLPATALFLSSSTILRILISRREAIATWVRELGSTMVDFWYNWVVEPTRKLIGTIRHDEASEVSIMSKKSLEGDRASLERMVVDFAVDNPDGAALSSAEIESVRAAVQEGDLTPVLKAYEKDLAKPFMGTVRGNLIRALLIQIQKTKVDVEVAMGGIDSLLKSQELVFGFIGLTPGLLVVVGLWRGLRDMFSNKRALRSGQTKTQSYRLLRNIDRILTTAKKTDTGTLTFEPFGLLVCEAIILRELASKSFPKSVYRDFEQDFRHLIDVASGAEAQLRTADRIRWAYARWL